MGRFRRIPCTRCGRTTAVNTDGRLRTHFCPHQTECGRGCQACEDNRAGDPADSSPAAPTAQNPA